MWKDYFKTDVIFLYAYRTKETKAEEHSLSLVSFASTLTCLWYIHEFLLCNANYTYIHVLLCCCEAVHVACSLPSSASAMGLPPDMISKSLSVVVLQKVLGKMVKIEISQHNEVPLHINP